MDFSRLVLKHLPNDANTSHPLPQTNRALNWGKRFENPPERRKNCEL